MESVKGDGWLRLREKRWWEGGGWVLRLVFGGDSNFLGEGMPDLSMGGGSEFLFNVQPQQMAIYTDGYLMSL